MKLQKQKDFKIKSLIKKNTVCDFSGGPEVKNPPSNTGDVGSIPGWGTNIPQAATREVHTLQWRSM